MTYWHAHGSAHRGTPFQSTRGALTVKPVEVFERALETADAAGALGYDSASEPVILVVPKSFE